MILAALLFIRRVVDDDDGLAGDAGLRRGRARRTSCRTRRIPPYVAIFRIHGRSCSA